MLRQGQESAGRVWLMGRYLDGAGRGVLRIEIIKEQITNKNSNLYLCGKRQLRNLLRQGEGVFWTRDKESIWLRSATRVAAALGVDRLTGRPVALPLSALVEGIGLFRAHLYAAFHSGRAKDGTLKATAAARGAGGASAMPIARATLARISGVGRSSQRAYEARLGLKREANFAVGEVETEVRQEERAWRQGGALFELKDYRGQQGQEGRTYLAWQLPNSYAGQHPQRPKGRQKRINRQLQDLVMKGMPGNEEGKAGGRGPEGRGPGGWGLAEAKRYFANGRLAGRSFSRRRASEQGDCYWRGRRGGNGRYALWHSWGTV
jgi:hypothetical protein